MDNYKEFLNDLHKVFKKYGIEQVYVDDWTHDIVFSLLSKIFPGYQRSPEENKLRVNEYFSYAYGTYFSNVLNGREGTRHKYIVKESGEEES